jgi:hypothetical protein
VGTKASHSFTFTSPRFGIQGWKIGLERSLNSSATPSEKIAPPQKSWISVSRSLAVVVGFSPAPMGTMEGVQLRRILTPKSASGNVFEWPAFPAEHYSPSRPQKLLMTKGTPDGYRNLAAAPRGRGVGGPGGSCDKTVREVRSEKAREMGIPFPSLREAKRLSSEKERRARVKAGLPNEHP